MGLARYGISPLLPLLRFVLSRSLRWFTFYATGAMTIGCIGYLVELSGHSFSNTIWEPLNHLAHARECVLQSWDSQS